METKTKINHKKSTTLTPKRGNDFGRGKGLAGTPDVNQIDNTVMVNMN